MYCSKCGKQVPDDANFCMYCGHDFSEDKIEEPILSCNDTETSQSDANIIIEEPNSSTTADNAVVTPVNDVENTEAEPKDNIGKKIAKRNKARKQREIEDAMALDAYTIKDEIVEKADTLPRERIKLTEKGSIASLKTKEIVLIVLSVLLMIASAIVITYINHEKKVNEDTLSGLVVLGYFLFFVIFFSLAMGVDRVYNLLTLNELAVRRITVKKYGFRLCPLMLKNGKVFAMEIEGECDMCNGENKGTYHIEWQNDELIAVCNYDRKHLLRIDVDDILGEEDATSKDA